MIPPLANNFVAAESAEDVLEHTRNINNRDVGAIFNLLGEHYHDPKRARGDMREYSHLIEGIKDGGHDACISIKPSQIGINIDAELFGSNFSHIVDTAISHDQFVWVDMEDHTTTDKTLNAVIENAEKPDADLGVAIQANLKRTRNDLKRLAETDATVRLVKGAYDEPKSVAYQRKEKVNKAYEDHLKFLFAEFDHVAVGSHDPRMISLARQLDDEYQASYEIQMLMGGRNETQFELANEGIEVYQYVPYGSKWMQYFYRRVKERKENLLFAARAILP